MELETIMTQEETIKSIKETCLKNPDGVTMTFNGNPINKDTGFYIAITNITGKNINYMIKKVLEIRKYAFNHLNNLYLGFWKNEGVNYLDIVFYFDRLNRAVNLGKTFNQKAIYDIKQKDSIFLKN